MADPLCSRWWPPSSATTSGYLAGLKGGYRLLLRWGPVIRLDHAKIKVGWYVFDHNGGKVVFFSRFVTVLRTYAAFLAGTNRMRLGRSRCSTSPAAWRGR
jgi:membrane protein DedA with SNARE-associated domain